jgi:hypothetical protein
VMSVESIIFWNVTPCSPVEVHGLFTATYCLHLQGRRVSNKQKRKQKTKLVAYLSFSSALNEEAASYSETSANLYTLLHGVKSKKIFLFNVTDMSSSDPGTVPDNSQFLFTEIIIRSLQLLE